MLNANKSSRNTLRFITIALVFTILFSWVPRNSHAGSQDEFGNSLGIAILVVSQATFAVVTVPINTFFGVIGQRVFLTAIPGLFFGGTSIVAGSMALANDGTQQFAAIGLPAGALAIAAAAYNLTVPKRADKSSGLTINPVVLTAQDEISAGLAVHFVF